MTRQDFNISLTTPRYVVMKWKDSCCPFRRPHTVLTKGSNLLLSVERFYEINDKLIVIILVKLTLVNGPLPRQQAIQLKLVDGTSELINY